VPFEACGGLEEFILTGQRGIVGASEQRGDFVLRHRLEGLIAEKAWSRICVESMPAESNRDGLRGAQVQRFDGATVFALENHASSPPRSSWQVRLNLVPGPQAIPVWRMSETARRNTLMGICPYRSGKPCCLRDLDNAQVNGRGLYDGESI